MKVRQVIEELNGSYRISTLCKVIGLSKARLSKAIKNVGMVYNNSTKEWLFEGDSNILNHDIKEYIDVQLSTNKNTDIHIDTYEIIDVPNSTNEYTLFTSEEMDVLKRIINDYQTLDIDKYLIYTALEKVPVNVEQERIANNVSKETSMRLKQFAKKRRLPLQDVVELAIIEMLDKYDK